MQLHKVSTIVLAMALCAWSSSALARDLNMAVAAKSAGQLDPHLSTKTEDKVVFGMVFNGLVRFAPGSMSPKSIEPDLAESWTNSKDGLVWTFKLRKGVQFHGQFGEFTSADVVYSLNRARDPKRSSVSSDYADFKSIEAVDPYTVRITLHKPIPSLLGVVANYHGGNIVSAKAVEKLGADFKTQPIGTGPFAFDKLVEGQSLRLVANKAYFRGAPKVSAITVRYISSDSARDLAFRSGELDLITGTRDDRWIKNFSKGSNGVVDTFEPGELRTLHLNMSMPPLDDIRVRQAVAHAINREELVAFTGPSVARANASPVPIGYAGDANDLKTLDYNPALAKELLAKAGHPNGLTIKVAITEHPSLNPPMQVIQAQLAKVGIKVNLEVMEHSAWHAAIRDNTSAMVLYGAARFPVADTYLTQFYHSASIVKTPKAVTNFSHCKAADDEIERARHEPDAAKQDDLWRTAQQKIVTQVCAVPLFELLQVWGRSPKVNYGYKLNGSTSLGPVITESTTLAD